MLYLKRKNKTIITSDFAKLLLHSVGFEVGRLQRMSLSYTNDVYKFTQNHKDYFIKFFTDQWCDENSGFREIQAIEMLKQKGISVPNCVYFGNADAMSQRNFAIFEKIKGFPLIKTLPRELSDAFIEDSLSQLQKLSTIKGKPGFFLHDVNIHKSYQTHFEFINDTVFYSFKKLQDLGYNIYDVPTLFERYKSLDSIIVEFSFCHNDFTPKHIFIDSKDRITGLIDFEWSVYSSPQSDGALWLTSLAEYGQPRETLVKVVDYCKRLEHFELFPYFVARDLILAASWPHKSIEQPYYSQTCLDKARLILAKKEFLLEDIIWNERLGVEVLENGN